MPKINKVYFVLAIIIAVTIAISISPDIYRKQHSPPNTTFPLIHNHPEDYFSYLSYMFQGWQGNWLITTRFTPEHFPPVLIFTFFPFLGHIAKLTGLSLPWTYFLARIIFGILLLTTCLYLCRKIFKKNFHFLLSCALISFSTGFWTIAKTAPSTPILPINQFLTFWSHLDPIMRATFLPHHLLGLSLAIISLVILINSLKTNRFKMSFLAGLLGFISAFIFYAPMLNIAGGIFIAIFLIFLKHKSFTDLNKIVLYFIPYILITSLFFIYFIYLSHSVFPWTADNNIGWQFTWHFPISEYIASIGPTFILTLIGLPIILSSDSLFNFIILGWATFPIIGIYIITPIYPKYGNMPFLEATSYIPFGILAVFGIKQLETIIKNRNIIYIGLIILFLYFIPPTISSVQKWATIFPTSYYNRFIPNEVLAGISWLGKNTPPESVVLAGGFFGNIIPAFSHNRVVYGHDMITYYSELKHNEVNAFFNEKDIALAQTILNKYHVSYVFFSLDTDPPRDEFIKALKLSEVYANNKVKIFQVSQ